METHPYAIEISRPITAMVELYDIRAWADEQFSEGMVSYGELTLRNVSSGVPDKFWIKKIAEMVYVGEFRFRELADLLLFKLKFA